MRIITLALIFTACNADKSTDDSAALPQDTGEVADDTGPVDADGDGFSAADDCDDTDATVNPEAEERCDGVDDDCDGLVDNDAADAGTWYADADGDGYTAPTAAVTACDQPPSTLAAPSDEPDCDDADAATHPGAVDTWYDGVDSDCDGASDNDADGDGYDAAGQGGEDCDDTNPDLSPAATETCDGVDNDCSGAVDDADACPCPVDWYDGHAYMFCATDLIWTDAQAACEAYGYHLADIGDAAENDWVFGVAQTALSADYWIGLNDIDTEGVWVHENGEPITYSNWHSGEPNDGNDGSAGTPQDWAQVYLSSGLWDDGFEWTEDNYVCELYDLSVEAR